jgi:hypothetical protein
MVVPSSQILKKNFSLSRSPPFTEQRLKMLDVLIAAPRKEMKNDFFCEILKIED